MIKQQEFFCVANCGIWIKLLLCHSLLLQKIFEL